MNWTKLIDDNGVLTNLNVKEDTDYLFCDKNKNVFIDTVCFHGDGWYLDCHDIDDIVAYAELPEAYDESNEATWINHNYSGFGESNKWCCSKCNGLVETAHYCLSCYYKYCPNCGEHISRSVDRVKT